MATWLKTSASKTAPARIRSQTVLSFFSKTINIIDIVEPMTTTTSGKSWFIVCGCLTVCDGMSKYQAAGDTKTARSNALMWLDIFG